MKKMKPCTVIGRCPGYEVVKQTAKDGSSQELTLERREEETAVQWPGQKDWGCLCDSDTVLHHNRGGERQVGADPAGSSSPVLPELSRVRKF